MINMLERGQCFLRLTEDGAPQPPNSYPTSILHGLEDYDQKWTYDLMQGVINRTRERFSVTRLTAEFQIAFAHDDLTSQDHLKWKILFRQERQSRTNIHSKQKRVKDENREVVQAAAFGGASSELKDIANQLFGSDNPPPNSMAT